MAAPMKFQTRVVGWKNKQEFKDTYDCLYDEDTSKKIDGLERINTWKCRFADKMPVAIECTSTLLEATLIEGCENEPNRLQLIYSMAIIRFVNLITGYLQNKVQAQPVVALAKEVLCVPTLRTLYWAKCTHFIKIQQISLPEWLVELRHEASHKHMPPLAVLRLAAKTGLAWLRENFWEKQCRSEMPSLPKVEEKIVYTPNINGVEDEIKRLSTMYQQAQYKNIRGGCRGDNDEVKESLSNLKHCLTDPEAKYLIISLLLQDGYLVPTSEQLQALSIKKGISYNGSISCIHRVLCQFWKPLVMLLDSLELSPLLLQHIIRELGRFKAAESRAADYLVGWAMQIVMAGTTCRKMYKAFAMLFKDSPELPWNDLFDECIQHPNRFTMGLLQYILPNVTPKLSKQAQLQVRQLSSIYCNAPETQEPVVSTAPDSSAARIYTEQDILRTEGGDADTSELPDEQSDAVDEVDEMDVTEAFVLKEGDQFQPWSASTAEVDWSKFPIGSLPGQPDDSNFLVLDVRQSNRRKRLHDFKSQDSTPMQASERESETMATKNPGSTGTGQGAVVKTEVDYFTKSELESIKQRIHVF